jgi:hypothetical protein
MDRDGLGFNGDIGVLKEIVNGEAYGIFRISGDNPLIPWGDKGY